MQILGRTLMFMLPRKEEKLLDWKRGVKSKKESEKKLKDHNSMIKGIAKSYAEGMITEPSELERKMQDFLDNQNVQYDFQKVFYIKKRNGYIRKFYIADFYIPSKSVIIETDGAFHDKQIKEDEHRTKKYSKTLPKYKSHQMEMA